MKLEDFLLSEISQLEKDTSHEILRVIKATETESRMVVARD